MKTIPETCTSMDPNNKLTCERRPNHRGQHQATTYYRGIRAIKMRTMWPNILDCRCPICRPKDWPEARTITDMLAIIYYNDAVEMHHKSN